VPGAEVLRIAEFKAHLERALPQRIATWLLERNAVHVISSDAHDDKHRKPILARLVDSHDRIGITSLVKSQGSQA
jgi:tyrosine-protein phosphatase YwqE